MAGVAHAVVAILSAVVAIIVVLALMDAAFQSSQYTGSIVSQGAVVASEGLGLNVTMIDWGNVTVGSSVSRPVTVTNKALTPYVLSYQLSNWIPQNASDYLTVSWDYDDAPLAEAEARTVVFTLHASENTTGIMNFSVDITLTGTQV